MAKAPFNLGVGSQARAGQPAPTTENELSGRREDSERPISVIATITVPLSAVLSELPTLGFGYEALINSLRQASPFGLTKQLCPRHEGATRPPTQGGGDVM